MDFKPGCLIAQEAGCVTTDFYGKNWHENQNGDVFVVNNKEIHKIIKEILDENLWYSYLI